MHNTLDACPAPGSEACGAQALPRPDQEDTLLQAQAVEATLRSLGAEVSLLPVSLDLAMARQQLMERAPDVVFNLVEELAGDIRLAPLATALVEHLGIACTGTGTAGLVLAGDKVGCKRVLLTAGVATPAWVTATDSGTFVPGRYLCKAVHEHASFGMDDTCLVDAHAVDAVRERIAACAAVHGGAWFAEQFVDGREFNVAVLRGKNGEPVVLPPAEMLFEGFDAGRPHIVGYAAKWDTTAPEYTGTVRAFSLTENDSLCRALVRATEACWHAFGLAGYARVDFRVGGTGTAADPYIPYVIDVNANPCIAPDAGLAAAALEAGMTYSDLVRAVVAAAVCETRR